MIGCEGKNSWLVGCESGRIFFLVVVKDCAKFLVDERIIAFLALGSFDSL